jgi:hypothetical protein
MPTLGQRTRASSTSVSFQANRDNCFGTDAMTHEIYETLVRKVIKSSLGGINGNCITIHITFFFIEINR